MRYPVTPAVYPDADCPTSTLKTGSHIVPVMPMPGYPKGIQQIVPVKFHKTGLKRYLYPDGSHNPWITSLDFKLDIQISRDAHPMDTHGFQLALIPGCPSPP